MPFYIFSRIKGGAASWDLVEEAASRAIARRAMIDYRILSKEHGGVEVKVIEAGTADEAREKAKLTTTDT